MIVAAALALALLIQAFLIKPYSIPSASMYPTLHVGQRVLVNRMAGDFASPHIGEILVFHPPHDTTRCANSEQGVQSGGGQESRACDTAQSGRSDQIFIKRVVGLPGDRLSIEGGHVVRNGRAERDPYIVACAGVDACELPQPFTIPHGDLYMMGDNRPDSDDSRYWGPVPSSWIIGEAFFTLWPPDRIGTL